MKYLRCLEDVNENTVRYTHFVLDSLRHEIGAPNHNDPFNRIMVAQAKAEDMLFLTHDSPIPYYNESCIVVV